MPPYQWLGAFRLYGERRKYYIPNIDVIREEWDRPVKYDFETGDLPYEKHFRKFKKYCIMDDSNKYRYYEEKKPNPESYEQHERWYDFRTPQPKMINVVPRCKWGAEEVTEEEPLDGKPMKIMLFYTGSEPCFTREECIKVTKDLQTEYITKRKLADIPYNFLIGANGDILEGRGWEVKPTKVHKLYKYSKMSGMESTIDIGFIGPSYKRAYKPRDRFGCWQKTSFVKPMWSNILKLAQIGVKNDFLDPRFTIMSEINT